MKEKLKQSGDTKQYIWWAEAQNKSTEISLGVRFNARPLYKEVGEVKRNLFKTSYQEVVKLSKSKFHKCNFYRQDGIEGKIIQTEVGK